MDPLTAIATALAAAASASSLFSESKTRISTPGTPAGGPPQKAETVFQTGIPGTSPSLPPALANLFDPVVQSQTAAMASGAPPVTSAAPVTGGLPPGVTPQMAQPKIPTPSTGGNIWGDLGNMAQALAAVAPLLGLVDQQKRQFTGSPAGGQGGQNVFALPRRQTLGEILAALRG